MKYFFDNYGSLRNNRFLHLLVVNLRYIIGLGFLPSGMVKILNQPFTRIENVGVFFDFLDALYTTGIYYNMIGLMQVIAGILLITQRYATIGAFLFLPIIFNITVLTFSTIGTLTPIVALLMLIGTMFFLLWDYYKWINIFSQDNLLKAVPSQNEYPTYNKIQMWTGMLLILIPLILISLELKTIGAVSVVVLLIAGNLISEWKQPVLRPLLKQTFGKSTHNIKVQKL